MISSTRAYGHASQGPPTRDLVPRSGVSEELAWGTGEALCFVECFSGAAFDLLWPPDDGQDRPDTNTKTAPHDGGPFAVWLRGQDLNL